ncbi:MAG: hypothetical protein ACE5JQ_08910 [Candidatus Methylomirabilales bacterium]
MEKVFRSFVVIVSAVLAITLAPESSWAAKEAKGAKQAEVVAGELGAFAKHLNLRPESAIDRTAVSGEYCFDVNMLGGGHMHHLAVDPMKTQEDVIDFVNAEPLTEAGVKVNRLPRFPGGLGTMKPNQWYFLPAGEMDPHHGFSWPFDILIKATNLK